MVVDFTKDVVKYSRWIYTKPLMRELRKRKKTVK